MAKRFTATDKWRDKWFRGLPPVYKCLWLYIVDECDNAGFWKVDFELAEFHIKAEVQREEALRLINEGKERIKEHKDYWEVVDFIRFQIGKLSGDNLTNLQKSCKNLLQNYIDKGILTGSVAVDYAIATDKGKGKDKGKDKEDKEMVKNYIIKTDSLSRVVYALKIVAGVKIDDRVWDKTDWARTSRSAKELITYFQNDEQNAIKCIEDLSGEFKKQNLSWTSETICKWKVDWDNQFKKYGKFLKLGKGGDEQ